MVISLFLALSLQGFAQTAATPEPPTNYYFVDYMKSTPGHTGDYIKLEMEVWKDIHKARIKNGTITGWYFLEVRMPSGANVEYDYITITAVSGWDGIDKVYNSWDGSVFQSLSKAQAKRADSTELYRTLVRTEIWAEEDAISKNPAGSPPPKYWLVNYMDVKDGQWDAYLKMEKETYKPVHQEQINSGHRAGWGLYSQAFPWGDEVKYEACAVDYFENWSDISADNMEAIWKKVHPGKNSTTTYEAITKTRSLGRGEIRVLLDYAQ